MNLIRLITPTNLPEEKKKFFSSETYEPTFTYNWNIQEIDEWLVKRPHYHPLVTAITKQDVSHISKEASRLFQTEINSEVLSQANNIITTSKSVRLHTDITVLAEQFTAAFAYFNIDFQVEITDRHGFNLRPSYSEKKIFISKHLQLEFFSPEGEVRHELTHIIRYVNGKHNNIKRSIDYLPTEEGLATYLHDYGGNEQNSSLFQHAAEYAITDVALHHGLHQMIQTLINWGFSKELAWQRAIRHKFGFVDTSQSGDIMKPSMYFFHEQKIKNLTSDEKLRLMNGKISINDLEKHKQYKGHISEEKIRSFYGLQ